MSERYVLVDRTGDVARTIHPQPCSAAEAWKIAGELNDGGVTFAPLTVAKLVPVPRPVPPRPTMDHGGHTLHVREGTLRFHTGMAYHACDIGTMQKAIALADATEQWEKEHGGTQG
jgi:murein DD-endopeptidase MepM/ murein hydrolase activator NlpD